MMRKGSEIHDQNGTEFLMPFGLVQLWVSLQYSNYEMCRNGKSIVVDSGEVIRNYFSSPLNWVLLASIFPLLVKWIGYRFAPASLAIRPVWWLLEIGTLFAVTVIILHVPGSCMLALALVVIPNFATLVLLETR